MERYDPGNSVATYRVVDEWEAADLGKQRSGIVLQRMKEEVVYQGAGCPEYRLQGQMVSALNR